MKKLLIKALCYIPGITATIGFLLVLCSALVSDADISDGRWLPLFLVGFAMFFIGSSPLCFSKK